MTLNFLKKLFSKPEPVIEKIKLDNLESWLAGEKKKVETSERKLVDNVSSRLAGLISELELEIKTLEDIDLKNKKAEEKIKIVVQENLAVYIGYLKKLIETIKKLEHNKIQDTIGRLNSVFYDFSKKSDLSFEKATFLIGKELGDVKSSISQFKKDLNSLLEENKQFLERLRIIENAESRMQELSEIKASLKEIEEQAGFITERAKDKEEAIKILETEAENVKKSPEYLEKEKKRHENEREREELKKSINNLRESIDFKKLASIFHVSEKKMQKLREYAENFSASLERDSESLINLLEEAKTSPELINKIKELAKKQREIQNFSEKPEILDAEREIVKIKEEIKTMENKKLKLEKAREKAKEARQTVIENLKKELEKINVYLEAE